MEYRDFEVRIGRREGQGYPLMLMAGDTPRPVGVLSLPQRGLSRRLKFLQQAVPAGMSGGLDEAMALGQQLFRGLFQGELLVAWRSALAQAETASVGLRLKLEIAPAELARLPWELLYDAEGGNFLSTSKFTPVLRTSGRKPRPLLPTPPWRLLIVEANPDEEDILNLQREVRRVKDALKPAVSEEYIIVEEIEAATIADLARRLSRANEPQPHIVHFMGHGRVGELLFETAIGSGATLRAGPLANLLGNVEQLRLVIFNACESALTLAAVVAQARVPAVIAMQYAVSDQAAILFSTHFYSNLISGQPVDAALALTRVAMQAEGPDADFLEWATPVLYMQAADGRLFSQPPVVNNQPPVAREPSPVPAMPPSALSFQPQLTDPAARALEESLLRRLTIYQRNLSRLEEQKAMAGADVPIRLLNEIDYTRDQVAQVEKELVQLRGGKS